MRSVFSGGSRNEGPIYTAVGATIQIAAIEGGCHQHLTSIDRHRGRHDGPNPLSGSAEVLPSGAIIRRTQDANRLASIPTRRAETASAREDRRRGQPAHRYRTSRK